MFDKGNGRKGRTRTGSIWNPECTAAASVRALRHTVGRMPRNPASAYIGRFAPSPSGPLHLGSLVAALGSWLDARAHSGSWLLRIEDLDLPRNAAGADASILASLHAHGLHWDRAVMRQSQRLPAYEAALTRLVDAGCCYPCACTRREVDEAGGIYPGTCRDGVAAGRPARAWRLRCRDDRITFEDRAQGRCSEAVAATVGDFILKRADGLFAYQLAVVVDDAAQGVSDVVRGADLLSSTARQILLQRMLGLATPRYLHLPLVCGRDGRKLSKQNLAPPLDDSAAAANLRAALDYLAQPLPPVRRGAARAMPVSELLAWAVAHWEVPHSPAAVVRPAAPEQDAAD